MGASVLALLLIPNRMFTFIYILFVGHYPIIKLLIEQLDKLWLEWILKFLYFNLILVLMYALFKVFILPTFNPGILALVFRYMAAIILAIEIVFALYDWVLSYMISHYDTFVRRIRHE